MKTVMTVLVSLLVGAVAGYAAAPHLKPTGNSAPGGFKGAGLVKISQGVWPCTSTKSCSFSLSIQATAAPTSSACSDTTTCGAFGSSGPNPDFKITWTNNDGSPAEGLSPLYAYGTLSAIPVKP
jgi:hypothetical protein